MQPLLSSEWSFVMNYKWFFISIPSAAPSSLSSIWLSKWHWWTYQGHRFPPLSLILSGGLARNGLWNFGRWWKCSKAGLWWWWLHTLYIYLKSFTCAFTMCDFMVYKLYFTKDEKRGNDCFKIIIIALRRKRQRIIKWPWIWEGNKYYIVPFLLRFFFFWGGWGGGREMAQLFTLEIVTPFFGYQRLRWRNQAVFLKSILFSPLKSRVRRQGKWV